MLYVDLDVQEFIPNWFLEVTFHDGEIFTWQKVSHSFSGCAAPIVQEMLTF